MRAAIMITLLALAGCSATSSDELPPLVYICPMPKDATVLEDHAGKCPVCGMELKPVRIVQAYTCLNNTAFIQATPGKCRINGTDLVPITASMFWVCSDAPDKRELEPGKCADGSDRTVKFEPRLHGDHNPRHGGQLFMADDGWHHVEGTFPGEGLFRVFFYDDWTRPQSPQGFTAQLIVGTETIPLQPSAITNAMEAKIAKASLPLSMQLKVRFKADEPEKIFDFTFRDFTKGPGEPLETVKPPEATQPPGAVPVAATPPAATGPSDPQPQQTSAVPTDPTLLPTLLQQQPIPATAREILAEMNGHTRELANKVEQGAPLGEFWFAALRTKDLGLALLNNHSQEIPAKQRGVAQDAADRLLRASFAIDNFGDLGDRERLMSAYDSFLSAVNDLKSAYASIR